MFLNQARTSKSFTCIPLLVGTGKTFAGVALINIFCSINKEIFVKGGKKNFVLFCGPSNKSVDLVTGIFFFIKGFWLL